MESFHVRGISKAYTDLDLVFASLLGQLLDERNVVNRTFKPMLERAQIPKTIRFYDLRHTAATLMLAPGANPRTAAERLGHAPAKMALDVYAHVLQPQRDDLTARIESSYFLGLSDRAKGDRLAASRPTYAAAAFGRSSRSGSFITNLQTEQPQRRHVRRVLRFGAPRPLEGTWGSRYDPGFLLPEHVVAPLEPEATGAEALLALAVPAPQGVARRGHATAALGAASGGSAPRLSLR
jgi:hypothetical protein